MIGWALRWVVLCSLVALLGKGLLERSAALLVQHAPQPDMSFPARPGAGAASNTIVIPADRRGHVVLDAAVNGAPVRMLVDTGASLVTLTPADARAAGIAASGLVFSGHANTANGPVRLAPVTLREVRIGQLSIYDVPAAVIENLDISLLGMSFLRRLQAYEMRDGKLSITW